MNPIEQKSTVSEAVRKHNEFLFPTIIVLLFGLFAFQLWYHAVRASVTVDESPHILAGYRHLQCGDYGINPEHPPMAKMLAAIPLQFRAMNQPPWDCGSQMTSKPDSFTYGGRFLVENSVDGVVVPTRLSIALLSLFLAAMVFLAAREMFGRTEALVALALLAFEPNLIGHGSVVTTDMALSATAFAFIYTLYRYCRKTSWLRFIVVGLALGLMLSAKQFGGFLCRDFLRAAVCRCRFVSLKRKPSDSSSASANCRFRRFFSHRINYFMGILRFSILRDSIGDGRFGFGCRLHQGKRSPGNGCVVFSESDRNRQPDAHFPGIIHARNG